MDQGNCPIACMTLPSLARSKGTAHEPDRFLNPLSNFEHMVGSEAKFMPMPKPVALQ
jgi:hypothetical protein